MEQSILNSITETVDGTPVKDLVWKPTDNIIRGLVKCPVTGRDNFNNGFVVCTWRANGSVTIKYGGKARLDMYLKIDNPKN
jgi:hypothetical protein